ALPRAGHPAAFSAECSRVVAVAYDRADAVRLRGGVERAVELPPAQANRVLELSPSSLDLRRLVGNGDEHHFDWLTLNDVGTNHAAECTARISTQIEYRQTFELGLPAP